MELNIDKASLLGAYNEKEDAEAEIKEFKNDIEYKVIVKTLNDMVKDIRNQLEPYSNEIMEQPVLITIRDDVALMVSVSVKDIVPDIETLKDRFTEAGVTYTNDDVLNIIESETTQKITIKSKWVNPTKL